MQRAFTLRQTTRQIATHRHSDQHAQTGPDQGAGAKMLQRILLLLRIDGSGANRSSEQRQ